MTSDCIEMRLGRIANKRQMFLITAGVDLFIEGDGKWEVEIKAIDCPKVPGSDGNIMLRFTGSNPWYIKLQARNTRYLMRVLLPVLVSLFCFCF